MKFRNAVLGIDYQYDFCHPNGSLFVPNADEDVKRAGNMISQNIDLIDYIAMTQDSHHYIDSAHPTWWRDKDGNQPAPFTMISSADVENGTWIPQLMPLETLDYLKQLEVNGEYPHTIWPVHCVIGSEGAAIMPEIMEAIGQWETEKRNVYQLVQKGEYPLAEHFGALRANVEYDGSNGTQNVPSTQKNQRFIKVLNQYKRVYLLGEAKNFCVANTLKQMLEFAPDLVQKLYIVEDCISDVVGVPDAVNQRSQAIYDEARQAGANFVTSTDPQFLQ
jgi:nicotinamidase/pyrazinamidase